MAAKYVILFIFIMVMASLPVYAEGEGEGSAPQQEAKGLDMVSDTVASVFSKANALLTGNLEITMSKDGADTESQYTRNAIGQKVPKSSAIKAGGALHNDQPL